MSWNRRRLLLAALASACLPKAPPPAPSRDLGGPVRLGWRWVPGVRHTYRSVVSREVDDLVLRRAEDWSYTAVELDSAGVVHLEGKLVGFGATVVQGTDALSDKRLDDAREAARAATPTAVSLSLRLSGRLVACSLPGFAEGLPHRLLALHFPAEPVFPGASWTDAGLLRAFDGALPVDVDARAEATTTLGAVVPVGEAWRATLSHVGRIQAGDLGPALELVGTSAWDTEPGVLSTRRIEARWRPDSPAQGRPVGTLVATLERLEA